MTTTNQFYLQVNLHIDELEVCMYCFNNLVDENRIILCGNKLINIEMIFYSFVCLRLLWFARINVLNCTNSLKKRKKRSNSSDVCLNIIMLLFLLGLEFGDLITRRRTTHSRNIDRKSIVYKKILDKSSKIPKLEAIIEGNTTPIIQKQFP